MSTSKARFQSSSSSKAQVKSSVGNASKRAQPTATAGNVSSGRASGPVQVIFNGKIVTPQSLIPRKGHHASSHKDSYANKKGKPLMKPQTIDESASDADRVSSTPLGAKLQAKKGDPNNDSRYNNKLPAIASKLNNKIAVEETATIVLSETPTQILLAMPSFVTASDVRDVMYTDERNAKYEQCVKAHSNVDGFVARASQTKNNPLKNQNEMAAANTVRECGSQAISYEIKDETEKEGHSAAEHDLSPSLADALADELHSLTPAVRKFVEETVGVVLHSQGCLLDTTQAIKPPAPGEKEQSRTHGKGNAKSKSRAANTSQLVNASEVFSGDDITRSKAAAANNKNTNTASDTNNNNNNNNNAPFSTTSSGAEVSSGPKESHSQSRVNASTADSNFDSEGERDNFANNSSGGGGAGYSGTYTEEDSEQVLRETQTQQILANPLLLKRLHMIERAIQQNANYRAQLDYRDLPDIAPLSLLSLDKHRERERENEGLFGGGALGKTALGLRSRGGDRNRDRDRDRDSSSERIRTGATATLHTEGSQLFSETSSVHSDTDSHSVREGQTGKAKFDPFTALLSDTKVKRLFVYSNKDLVGNRSVSAMAWNTVSSDLLAVAYARTQDLPIKSAAELTDEAQEGLVLFWSLRNPDYPEKFLRTSYAVTSLDFSRQNPMILAVGLANGDVNVYDVKREGANWQVPVESSAGMQGAHLEPVWQVKWVTKGQERTETLVSISTDGRVLEWNLKKGLMMSTLMQLKKSGAGEGWISNSAAGLCFDFQPSDPSIYVTGTEDGSLFRCSVSYNEQYLETYQAHEGPVYRVKFSPRWPSVFLTCSADWSMNLFHLHSKTPLLTLRATSESFPVSDVCWCPGNATVFACVTVDAKLQIWDLSVSALDPVVTVDIGQEDEKKDPAEEALSSSLEQKSSHADHAMDFPPASAPLGASRFLDRNEPKEEVLSPMNKLLKNLRVEPKRRVLTTVLFGEKNPILAVGDNKGNVSIYRVFDPVTINHLGPLQQYQKLKGAVMRQTDPTHAAALAQEENNSSQHEEKM